MTGGVSGVAVDPTGAAIGGLSVALGGSGVRDPWILTTDAGGSFEARGLQPGSYTLHLQSPGFQPVIVRAATVAAGQTLRLRVILRPAVAAATVVVSATALERPSLADSPVNELLTPGELLDLPLDGRRFQSFALLTPIVNLADTPSDTDVEVAGSSDTPAASDAASETPRLSVRGSDPSQNATLQDGLSDTRAYDGEPRGGASLPFTRPLESVREFRVAALGGDRPAVGGLGGAVEAISRRADEGFHGSAFFLIRHSVFAAVNPYAVVTRYNSGAPTAEYLRPRDQREQFGGSAGRVLPHTGGRLSGLVAAEFQRRSFPGISSPDSARFYTLTAIQRDLLANRGVSDAAVTRGLNFLDSLSGEVPRHVDENALVSRLDYTRSDRAAFVVDWNRIRHRAPSALYSQPVVARSRDQFDSLETHTDALTARWTEAAGARWLHELRLQAAGDLVELATQTPLPGEPRSAPGGLVPQVSIDLANSSSGGAFRFGTPGGGARRRLPLEKRAEAQETLTFSTHAHTAVLGAGGSLLDTSVQSGVSTNGSYRYASGAVNGRAGGLVDFLTDAAFSSTSYPNGACPSIYATVHLFCFRSYSQSYGAGTEVRFHTAEASIFAGDAWRISPRLRVNAGLRYEHFRVPPAISPNAALDSVFGRVASTAVLPGNQGHFNPYVGVAWAATDRTVVRAGYSLHLGRLPGRVLEQALEQTALPRSSFTIQITPRTEVEPQCASVGTNFGYPATFSCTPGGAIAGTTHATVLSRALRLPYVQEGELTAEHEFRRGLSVSLTYALSLERKLLNSIDLNLSPATTRASFRIVRADGRGEAGVQNGYLFNVPLYTARLSPLYGAVTAAISDGTGAGHAGVIQVTERSRPGLILHAAYTFSRVLDSAAHTGSALDENSEFDPADPRYDKGLSNFDRVHKLVVSGSWHPALHARSAWLRAAANEWTASPLLFFTSGRPYSYLIEGGTELTGGRTSINGSGGATFLPTVGRNTLRLSPLETVDLRLTRGISAGEHGRVRITADAFNLLNHRNTTSVEQRAFLVGATAAGVTSLVYQDNNAIAAEGLNTRAFGTPSAAASTATQQRRLQFGVRYDW